MRTSRSFNAIHTDSAFNVVVTNGPGFEIERIPGFLDDGRPMDSAGPNLEFPFIFEYAGPLAAALQGLHDDFVQNGTRRGMSIVVNNLAGNEVFRWNMYNFALTRIEAGEDGRNRYTFETLEGPDNVVRIDDGGAPPDQTSNNLATDTRIEVENVRLGSYPVVEVDAANHRITLTFDYIEAGDAFRWARRTAMGLEDRRSMSIIHETGGTETGRTNYFEVFPISFQHVTGFGQVEKVKLRIVLTYGWSEVG